MVGSAYVPFESLTVLENRTYIVGYSESRMNPLWVSYRAYEVAGDGTAPDDFAWRIDCRTDSGVTYDDFTHTRYQRGHFAPKETMYDCYGTLGVFDSFLLSNTSPQIGGFNGGIWSALERRIREEYCEIFGEVWVITGAVFDDSNDPVFLSKNPNFENWPQSAVEVPDSFYMILIVEGTDDMIDTRTFVLDHAKKDGNDSRSISERLIDGLRSIDVLQDLTGIDFLSELPDEIEAYIESREHDSLW